MRTFTRRSTFLYAGLFLCRVLPNVHTGAGHYLHRISIEAKRKIRSEMEEQRKVWNEMEGEKI